MNINTIQKKLKLILSKTKLNKLGKETGFTKRERNITTFQLVTAMICNFSKSLCIKQYRLYPLEVQKDMESNFYC